jgi:glycosyltransferase involved in cell wall biosynthesis
MNADRRGGQRLRAVFVCQAVDRDDPVLATTVRWIEALARKPSIEQVAVLALRAGQYELPATVDVTRFGRSNRLATAMAFYRALLSALRPRPDFFFVYQGGPYPVLLLPVKLLASIPIVQWKAHPVITRSMAFYARWCDDLIFTAARASFPMPLPKVRVVGHGIDAELFRPGDGRVLGDLIAACRLSPRKRIEQMIEAVVHANRRYGTAYRLNVYGATLAGDEAYVQRLEALIDRLEARNYVVLHGAVRQEHLPALLNGHRASLNFSDTAIDKSALEAMACGLPVVSTNDSITEVVPPDLRPALIADKQVTELQAKIIHELLQRPQADLDRLGERLRDLVVTDHSIDRLFGRILDDVETLIWDRG